MLDVILIDDEWYNLEEIGEFVEETGFMSVKRKYQNPLVALDEFHTVSPDVAFIDISMPEMEGTVLAKQLQTMKPSLMVVFLTAWKQYAAEAFDLNAVDYILKPIRKERFKRMSEKLMEKAAMNAKDTGTCLNHGNILSEREAEALMLLAQGMTRNEIASKMNISISTVKRHTENIYRKLEVNNKVTAVKRAEALNLL